MQLTALSKTLTTIGLIAALSVVVGSDISRTVQAQTQKPADTLAREKACDLAMQENGEATDGGMFFDDFRGLNLTDAQKKAYEALDAQAEANRAEVYKQSISVIDPNSPLIFMSQPGVSIPPDVQAAIDKALESKPKLRLDEELNQQFGKYGVILAAYTNYLTPEQETQLDQIKQDFHAQVQDLMTPEQQPQYRTNLAARLKIDAVCDMKPPFSAYSYPALGQISDTVPGTK